MIQQYRSERAVARAVAGMSICEPPGAYWTDRDGGYYIIVQSWAHPLVHMDGFSLALSPSDIRRITEYERDATEHKRRTKMAKREARADRWIPILGAIGSGLLIMGTLGLQCH